MNSTSIPKCVSCAVNCASVPANATTLGLDLALQQAVCIYDNAVPLQVSTHLDEVIGNVFSVSLRGSCPTAAGGTWIQHYNVNRIPCRIHCTTTPPIMSAQTLPTHLQQVQCADDNDVPLYTQLINSSSTSATFAAQCTDSTSATATQTYTLTDSQQAVDQAALQSQLANAQLPFLPDTNRLSFLDDSARALNALTGAGSQFSTSNATNIRGVVLNLLATVDTSNGILDCT